jgi:hypothetical protein
MSLVGALEELKKQKMCTGAINDLEAGYTG